MPTVYVEGKPYEVPEGRNLLQAGLSLGFNIPYFCWHPALGSVGACRQCAVKQFKDEEDEKGRLIMACMTAAQDGTRISIADGEAQQFRAAVIEALMVNHPHDCPVCDEGGECHLQDMTLMTGHTYREYRFEKRTYRNQDLGPLINHEMNRCIQCYRCVRFYRDFAGGKDLDAFASHDHVYFGRAEDGPLESEFSGNLVEVCPTGVFTDKTLKRHYTRPWDLQTAPSVCVHCGLGCNTIPGERYGKLRRIRNRFNGEVNGYFLCDRGRYGYEFVNSNQRVRQPLIRKEDGEAGPVSGREAVEWFVDLVKKPERVLGIGSPRASLEANFALRSLVGPERFCLGMAAQEAGLVCLGVELLQKGPLRTPSLQEVAKADAVFVLGEDVTQTAPVLALALRQSVRQQPMQIADALKIPRWDDGAVREAVQEEKGPLFVATPAPTRLDDAALRTVRGAPEDLARLGFAVARALDGKSDDSTAGEIAGALQEAERPVVVCGPGCGSEALVRAAAQVAQALCRKGRPGPLFLTAPECNSVGVAMMGGFDLEEAFRRAEAGEVETLVVLENDLYRRMESGKADRLLEAAGHVVALDHICTRTTGRAEVVLPAGTFAESDGTLVNNEGRAQRFYQVFTPEGEVQESWRWLQEGKGADGLTWRNLDDVMGAMAEAMPVFTPVLEAAPPSGFRIAGQKTPRQPHRYSGRTAMRAQENVHEPKPPEDPDSALAFSMEGYPGRPPSSLIPFYWAPGWNSVQALGRFQSEVGGHLHDGDPGKRLLEPGEGEPPEAGETPRAFEPREGERLVVPLYHIFGSEELSVHSPGIAQRMPEPYVALSPGDTLAGEDEIELQFEEGARRLPVRTLPGLPEGLAGMPAGLPGLEIAGLPVWSRISRG